VRYGFGLSKDQLLARANLYTRGAVFKRARRTEDSRIEPPNAGGAARRNGKLDVGNAQLHRPEAARSVAAIAVSPWASDTDVLALIRPLEAGTAQLILDHCQAPLERS